MKSNKKNYLLITIYGLCLIFVFLGINNLYGSNTDWISQHIVIPDYLRKIFYETKNILPNLAINMGAGQNIFNYSYYGLLSPIILISYFLPFLDMTTFIIIASIILYLLSGLLMYKFLVHNFNKSTSLGLSLAFITLAFMYHFHHHIMFVWNIPFIILAFIGIDKYVEKNKSFLLMLSLFLMIMTNYYYSVPGLLCILIYGVYKILTKDKFQIKTFLLDILKASIRVIIPLLMAGILLFPTANIILETGRTLKDNLSLFNLFLPNLDEITYKAFSMGLTGLFLISPIGLLLTKKKDKSQIFLSIVLLIITFIPLIMYVLNGFLYIRGKVLIPFSILYIFSTAHLIKKIKEKNLDLKRLLIGCLIVIVLFLIINFEMKTCYFALDVLITLIILSLYQKYQHSLIIFLPLLSFLIINYYNVNLDENYVSIDRYQAINNKEIASLIEKLPKDDFYRTYSLENPLETSNKYYSPNYYGISIYSSNYNSYYRNFYNNLSGNNIINRNSFVTAGTNNELFYDLMGVKYVISKNNLDTMEEVTSSKDLKLYLNNNAYPILYATKNVGSIKVYDALEFPYNLDYLLANPVTNKVDEKTYESHINEVTWEYEKTYELTTNKTTKYTYELPKPVKSNYLIIKFTMDYKPSCTEGDTYITINGIKNKLTCNEWMYHNQNYEFEYIIPNSTQDLKELSIKFSKGHFKLSHIGIYTYDFVLPEFIELSNLKIDKKNSTITGESKLEDDGYIISSLPYDKGYKVYIDEEEKPIELVNKAFLGFKISKGNHQIKITYHSPWLLLGTISTIFGFLAFIALLIYEKFTQKINSLLAKNYEIIMYLIFGVLTTLVSIVSYIVLTKTILNPENNIELQIANVLSWIISVTFAYITNRQFVFASKNKNILKEAFKFYESRILTLLLDMLLMFIFVSKLGYNDTLIKIINQFLVIIGNYILSKLVVFKKEGSKK